MSRFYVPEDCVKGNKIFISAEEAHHILDVMRLKKMDKVVIFDGTGKEYTGIITDVKRGSLTVEIIETRTSETGEEIAVTLIQAIPKKDKMDYIIEKATELGVSSIMPLISDRTIISWDEKKMITHVERWRKIAKESSKQCGRADIPGIYDIKSFDEAIKGMGGYDLMLIAALNDDAIKLKGALKDFKGHNIAIAIGPEGDFAPGEVKLAKAANFKLVNLGRRVLRSDTASLAVLSILNYEFSS